MTADELVLDSDTLTWDEACALADKINAELAALSEFEIDDDPDYPDPDDRDPIAEFYDELNQREEADERRAGIR